VRAPCQGYGEVLNGGRGGEWNTRNGADGGGGIPFLWDKEGKPLPCGEVGTSKAKGVNPYRKIGLLGGHSRQSQHQDRMLWANNTHILN
jgi:hypothetical protein